MSNKSTQDLDENVHTLHNLFKNGLDNYNQISNSNEPTNSSEVQLSIKRTMKTLEEATKLVSLSDIFSTNEGIDEVSTNDLQYFLLPALLGSLSLKLTSGERKDIVNVAEVYFKDFLNRCTQYGIGDYTIKTNQKTESSDGKTEFEQLELAVNSRAHKIESFRRQKELQSKLENLKVNMENEHVDEEIKRDYFLTMIRLFMLQSISELSSIEMEKPILEHIANIKRDDVKPSKRPPPPPLKPIIITRDEVQKAVYGAGYPSLPTMTVQEFYDKRVADGVFPDPNKKKTSQGQLSLQESALAGISLDNEEEKDQEKDEKLLEEDDDENMARMRAKDEFKDEHRRGWGNRMNRS